MTSKRILASESTLINTSTTVFGLLPRYPRRLYLGTVRPGRMRRFDWSQAFLCSVRIVNRAIQSAFHGRYHCVSRCYRIVYKSYAESTTANNRSANV